MIKNFTYGELAAQVARTSAALPNADWNDSSKPVEQEKAGLDNPRLRAAFVAAKQEAPPERRAKAISGPVEWTTSAVLVYRPRWKTDHHPWVLKSTYWADKVAGGGIIRFANYEVEEVQS